jgi:hypothetical protein
LAWRIGVAIGLFLAFDGVAAYLWLPGGERPALLGVRWHDCDPTSPMAPTVPNRVTASTRTTDTRPALDAEQSAVDVVVCFATRVEGEDLPPVVAGRSLARLRMGIGAVNAAVTPACFLTAHRARAVIACGVGRAYPGSGLTGRRGLRGKRGVRGSRCGILGGLPRHGSPGHARD